MRNQLVNMLAPYFVKIFVDSLSYVEIRVFLNEKLTELEELIIKSSTKFDDNFLPIIKTLREVIGMEEKNVEENSKT